MERILRGVARFSDLGFTKSRMAFRLWISAENETSAHTGRPIADVIFFVGGILVSGHFPEFLFYGIPASVFELATGWGEKDNSPIGTGDAAACGSGALKRKRLGEGSGRKCVRSDAGSPKVHTNSCAAADCSLVGRNAAKAGARLPHSKKGCLPR